MSEPKIYKAGAYYLRHFGFYGEKLATNETTSLIKAQRLAEDFDAKEHGNSTVILRCLDNTKVKAECNK